MSWIVPALVVFATASVWLSVIDVREHRLPNAVTVALLPVMVALVALAAWREDDWQSWGRGLAAGVVLFIAYLVLNLVCPAGLGMGDVKLARRLSDALDLLNLCVESGMGLQPAMAQVASTQDGPVAAEFTRVLREMQLGMSRTQAFEALGARTRQPDLKRFVAAIARTESMGIPVASLMKEQSAQMRARRLESAREKAQKVPVKILLPVIVCLLPALFIIVIGPAAISMVRAFAQM